MYRIIMRKYWKDGTFTEIDADKSTFTKFHEAADLANQMNKHIWLFHQNEAPWEFYYVKEI